MAARSLAGVSPVRTAARMAGGSPCAPAASNSRMPVRGSSRLSLMSLESAFSGETYTTSTASSRRPSSPWRTSASMAARKAASVFPDPVGAAISVERPSRREGQASLWASVGPPGNRPRNHDATTG